MSGEADLTPFCSKDEGRSYLHTPFTRGGFTYATDGRVCVRVPRREGVVGHEKAPDASKVFPSPLPQTTPLRIANLPEREMLPCGDCDDSGLAHSCPDCTHVCEKCGGSLEYEEHRTVRLRGKRFSAIYLRMVAALPGVEAAIMAEPPFPKLYFRFDGGDGVLMGQKQDVGDAIDAVEPAP